MPRTHLALGMLAALAVVSCGVEQAGGPGTTGAAASTTPGTASPSAPVASAPEVPADDDADVVAAPATSPAARARDASTSAADTSDASSDATTRTTASEEPAPPAAPVAQPAVWPGPGVVFATPEEAAADFVSAVFGVEPVLGPYRAGDQRSGEIDVLFAGEGDGGGTRVNSGLALRQLPPDDGWFVLFGVAEAVSITSPTSGASVDAGPVTVEGVARGFEGTVVVSAFPAGDASDVLATEIARGGPLARPEPYSATVDLADAPSDRPVALLVRGDTGADGDTGEFSVIPITVSQTLPEMR